MGVRDERMQMSQKGLSHRGNADQTRIADCCSPCSVRVSSAVHCDLTPLELPNPPENHMAKRRTPKPLTNNTAAECFLFFLCQVFVFPEDFQQNTQQKMCDEIAPKNNGPLTLVRGQWSAVPCPALPAPSPRRTPSATLATCGRTAMPPLSYAASHCAARPCAARSCVQRAEENAKAFACCARRRPIRAIGRHGASRRATETNHKIVRREIAKWRKLENGRGTILRSSSLVSNRLGRFALLAREFFTYKAKTKRISI